jgi:hypothetical protein
MRPLLIANFHRLAGAKVPHAATNDHDLRRETEIDRPLPAMRRDAASAAICWTASRAASRMNAYAISGNEHE